MSLLIRGPSTYTHHRPTDRHRPMIPKYRYSCWGIIFGQHTGHRGSQPTEKKCAIICARNALGAN